MWVYNFTDYKQVFDLSEKDLRHCILDYPAGISSFNAQMHALGHRVISGDENYQLSAEAMAQYAEELLASYAQRLRTNAAILQDSDAANVQAILAQWQQSKTDFIQDYAAGKQDGRYQSMQLPQLPFKEAEFRLALCSDLLFHTQSRSGHSPEQLLTELLRVAEEVRVYPLLNEKGDVSNELGPVMLALQQQNFGVEVRSISYQRLKGGNAMLRVWARECTVE